VSHQDVALAALQTRRDELQAAEAHHRECAARARETAAEHRAATAATTEAELRKLRLNSEVSAERAELAAKAVDQAERAVTSAERSVEYAQAGDRHEEQAARGIVPICEREAEVRQLAARIDVLRAEQAALFAAEVAPRNDPWMRSRPRGFENAPEHHYEALLDVLHRHAGGPSGEPSLGPVYEAAQTRARIRTEWALANPPPQKRWEDALTAEQQDALRFCCECRGQFVPGDLQLTTGVLLAQLAHIGGWGPEVASGTPGYVHIDGALLGEIASGLSRAVNIAESLSRSTFDAATYARRRNGWNAQPSPVAVQRVEG
jgi:hypothetical protein